MRAKTNACRPDRLGPQIYLASTLKDCLSHLSSVHNGVGTLAHMVSIFDILASVVSCAKTLHEK